MGNGKKLLPSTKPSTITYNAKPSDLNSHGKLALTNYCETSTAWLPKQKKKQRSLHVDKAILRDRLLQKSCLTTALRLE